ncbi:MAG: hypothetical protein LBO09_05355 [Candidatus Peribacteria bacterium]|jgi:hypothetical protein|nr:hypothetical protein [Candidatus Peribacteria bacterium]
MKETFNKAKEFLTPNTPEKIRKKVEAISSFLDELNSSDLPKKYRNITGKGEIEIYRNNWTDRGSSISDGTYPYTPHHPSGTDEVDVIIDAEGKITDIIYKSSAYYTHSSTNTYKWSNENDREHIAKEYASKILGLNKKLRNSIKFEKVF